jgi:hypothetical protein
MVFAVALTIYICDPHDRDVVFDVASLVGLSDGSDCRLHIASYRDRRTSFLSGMQTTNAFLDNELGKLYETTGHWNYVYHDFDWTYECSASENTLSRVLMDALRERCRYSAHEREMPAFWDVFDQLAHVNYDP